MISVVVLAISVEEGLGMMFGTFLMVVSFWLVHRWVLKPEKEWRRKQAELGIEATHRKHWRNWQRNRQSQ